MTCPQCRDEIEALQERLRYYEAIFIGDGLPPEAERLTAQERRLFAILLKRKPHPVSKDQLLAALYFDSHEDRGPKIVDVLVCKIRKKLIGHGVHIRTSWGIGFSLHDGEDPTNDSYDFPRGRTPRWTSEEDDIVRQSRSPRDAAANLDRRTPNAVWARAQKIGHSWGGRHLHRRAA